MPEMQSLFNQGNLAVLANVGTLVEPITLNEFDETSSRAPLGLFSHIDQIEQWQTSLPDRRAGVGWGGRMADILASGNNSPISMNINLSGSNVFQNGENTREHVLADEGLFSYGGQDDFEAVYTRAVDNILNQQYAHVFERVYAQKLRQAIDNQAFYQLALDQNAPLETDFESNSFSVALSKVAQSIQARGALSQSRQTFFITFGGWDHHDEVINNQAAMLGVVSRGLRSFYTALEELGLQNQVTTFTISDFGRTLTSNGRGSDHGWGGNQLIMGGAVNGGAFYGNYPALFAGNSLDTGRGRLIPTTSVDAYFAELALWFGVWCGVL